MINQQITLSYPDIYGHQPEVELHSLFEGTSQIYASSLIQIMNVNEQVYNGTEKLINYLRTQLFCRDNVKLYLEIEKQIETQARRFPDAEMVIFNPPSAVLLAEN